jgi:hypothetical protein
MGNLRVNIVNYQNLDFALSIANYPKLGAKKAQIFQ